MLSALTFPFLSETLFKTGEKQQLTVIMTAVSDLRRQAVNRMAVGELEIQGRDLILFLDNREIRRFTLPHPPRSDGAVFFNRFGICSGGALRIRLSRVYLVRIAPISGKISLETP